MDLLIGPVGQSPESPVAMEEESIFVAGDLEDKLPGVGADCLELLSIGDLMMMRDPQRDGSTLIIEIIGVIGVARGKVGVMMAAVGILGEGTGSDHKRKENQKEKSLHRSGSKTHFVRGLTPMTKA